MRHTAFVPGETVGVLEAEMKEEGIGASFGFRDGKLRDEGRFVFDFDFERIAVDDAAGQVKNLEQFAGGEAMLGDVSIP